MLNLDEICEGVLCNSRRGRHDSSQPERLELIRESPRLGDVAKRVKAAGENLCIVTTEDGVVLGRLRSDALEGDPDASVEAVMESGPATIRPDTGLAEFTEHMRTRRVGSILVTTSTGQLIGVLYRKDAEARLGS